MKILVLNSGSSSLKYKLFSVTETEFEALATGLVDRIGLKSSSIKHTVTGQEPIVISEPIPTHKVALELVKRVLTRNGEGVIKDFSEITGVGHRVVHGGEKFKSSVKIDENVIAAIKECCDLAPLHNPPNVLGIEACQEILPGIPEVAVFDTAFHQTMPPKAFLYGLEYNQYVRYGIRRYGFHGTSHRYVSREAARVLGTDISELKLITCHIGNGCSLTAVMYGESVDTSMGLTPLEGVVMGTRCGDIDPYVPLYIMDKEGLTLDELNELLQKKSGLLGLCGQRDMRDVITQIKKKDKMAQIAMDVFAYRFAKYIGSYTAAMNGTDAIIFAGGIGENSAIVRSEILNYFTYLGITIDQEKNDANETIISTPDSAIKVLIIPTNEELVIAEDTYRIIFGVKS